MKNEGALRMRFSGMTESIGRCVITSCKPGPEYRIPVGSGPGYRARRKETRSTHRRDEFRPAIPQRGCGRDAGHPTPPAQIRTCRITAYGSSLGFWRQNEHQDKDEEYAGKESTG